MTCSLFAAPPQAFRYQAVVRDNTGAVVADTDMQVRVNILREGPPGTLVTVNAQNHTTRSNAFGMINLEIGRGTHFSHDLFSAIDWGAGAHHVQLEINIDGSGFVNLGAAELLSVPYALFAANAGGGGGDSYWEFEEATNRLRNINTGTVFIGGGVAPDPFPVATTARLHVDGSVEVGDGLYIASPASRIFKIGTGSTVDENTEIAFSIGHENTITTSAENVFILGAGNTVTRGENVFIFGEGNEITGDETGPSNDVALLIGRRIEVESGAINNILIGDAIVSEVDNVIALGAVLEPSQHSIFIGRNIIDDGIRPGNTNNILMGHDMEITEGLYDLPIGERRDISNSVFIGSSFRNWNNNTATGVAFSADQTIGIGNNIHPHRTNLAGGGGHNSINIGNRISTSSERSINIGVDITADFITASGARETIAIGRDITFPATTVGGTPISHHGAIVLGTSHPTLFPYGFGGGGPGNTAPPGAIMSRNPHPRFIVGGHSRTGAELHFLYIDDFANAHFGFVGPASSGPLSIISGPFTGIGGGIANTVSGGLIFARQVVAITPEATPSDRELKTNIVPIRERLRPPNAGISPRLAPASGTLFTETLFTETLFAEALSTIPVYSYNYTFEAADPREQWGLMAQDVLPHFPHLIQSFDGENLMMIYQGFIPILWSIAQDQQVQIEEQQARIIELEERLRRIEAALGLD